MLVVFLLCILFCACAVIKWRACVRESRAHGLPPSLSGALPIIGHAHLLLTDNEKLWEVTQTFADECVRQGGVMYGKILRDIYYVITDPDDAMTAANACLQKHYAYKYVEAWVGNGLVTGSGEKWKLHRRLLNPAFSVPIIHSFLGVFNNQSRKLVNDLEPHAGKSSFDIFTHFRHISMETFCLTSFGIDGVQKDFVQKYMKASDEILYLAVKRFRDFYLHNDLIFNLSGLKKRETKAIRVLNKMSYEIMQRKKASIKTEREDIESRSKTKNSGRYKPLLDLLLSMDEALTDQEIKEEIDTAIIAGYDTTSLASLYLTILVGSHPDVQEKVYEELIAVLGPDRDVGKDDLNRLLYTEAVIKETLRYISGAPVLLRYVDRDVKLKKYTMRAGCYCALLLVGTHRDPVWGPDSDRFRPERWLDAISIPDNANAFGGFSWGKRSCIGKTYALVTMKVTMAHFFRRYRVTADFSKLRCKLDFMLKPSSGYHVSIERRN